jgi:intergrase/recombinase
MGSIRSISPFVKDKKRSRRVYIKSWPATLKIRLKLNKEYMNKIDMISNIHLFSGWRLKRLSSFKVVLG